MKQNETNLSPKIPKNLWCEKCDYFTCNKKDFTKHISTLKHKNKENETKVKQNETKKIPNLTCDCGIIFNSRTTLWRHTKKCLMKDEKSQLLLEVIKKDNELKEFLMEQNKQLVEQNKELIKITQNAHFGGSTSTINNTINSNNNFNLNLFLNEKCKDALNISDFVNSLVLGIKDLENTARLGYADGISKIFINGLKQLDVYKRPVHCSDLKREIIYIKDDNKWEKDDTDKIKMTKAIKNIANKNIRQLGEWQKQHPTYSEPSSKENDEYNKIICESMSGACKNEQSKNYEKIIKNISKEVLIDK